MRRQSRPRANHNLARRRHKTAPCNLDSKRASVFEGDFGRARAGQNRQIAPPAKRPQIRRRRALPPPAMNRHIHPPKTLLLEAVGIGGERIAGLAARFDESRKQRIDLAGRFAGHAGGHEKRAGIAAIIAAALGIGLAFLKVRQNARVIPAVADRLAPAFVIARVAAHIRHRVQRRRAAQNPPARAVDFSAVEIGLRDGMKMPVVFVVDQVAPKRRRYFDLPRIEARIRRPRLDQQDLAFGVFAQARRQNAAGAAAAHNHIIKAAFHFPILIVSPAEW